MHVIFQILRKKVYFLSKNSPSLNTLKLSNSFWRKHNREISITSALNSCRIRLHSVFAEHVYFGHFALSVIPNANNVINYSLHTTCRCNLHNAHLSDMVNLVETIRNFRNICKLKNIWLFERHCIENFKRLHGNVYISEENSQRYVQNVYMFFILFKSENDRELFTMIQSRRHSSDEYIVLGFFSLR